MTDAEARLQIMETQLGWLASDIKRLQPEIEELFNQVIKSSCPNRPHLLNQYRKVAELAEAIKANIDGLPEAATRARMEFLATEPYVDINPVDDEDGWTDITF